MHKNESNFSFIFSPFSIGKKPSDYIQFKNLYFRLPTAGNGTNRCTIVLSVGGSDFARRIAIVRPT